MNLARLGIRYPITTYMFFTSLALIGIFSLRQLGLDLMPELEVPTIAVTTYYPGAAPQEVESEITEVLEEYLSTVSDLDELESISKEGVSIILLKFKWGMNLDEAANDIRDKIDMAKKELPGDAGDPIVFKFNLSMIPVLILGLTADQSYEDLYEVADDLVCDRLEAIPGVAAALIRGGNRRQLNIRLHLDKLNAYRISPREVEEAIKNANLNLPIGYIKSGQKDFLVRVPEKASIEELKGLTIRNLDGRKVYLKDIADVEFGFEEATREVRVNGRRGLIIFVQKRSGENTVEVVRRVKRELNKIKDALPPDVDLFPIRDFSEFIELTIGNLRTSLIWGALLVAFLIFTFIGELSSSLIILTALPTCLLISFFLLYLGGYTLNIISLSSLAIALGMVVDGAIVVIDNIARKRREVADPNRASIEGTGEVSKAIIASVLTTVVVFFPVLFMGGITGILFKQMAFVITLTLFVSLLNALWLIPTLASKFKQRGLSYFTKFTDLGRNFINYLEARYEFILKKVLERPLYFFGAILLIFSITFSLFPLLKVRFFPEADSNFFMIEAELPLGARMEETGRVVGEIASVIEKEVPERQAFFERWGYGEEISTFIGWEEGSNIGTVGVRLVRKGKRRRSVFEIVDGLRKRIKHIPGAEIRFDTQDPLVNLLYGGGKPLALEIYGRDLDRVMEFATKLMDSLKQIPGIYDLDISRKVGAPEIVLRIQREKAEELGLSVREIAYTLRTLLQGKDVLGYTYLGKDYDINIRLREEDRSRLEDLGRIYLMTKAGKGIKLSELVEVKESIGPAKIERKDQQRLIKIGANLRGIGLSKAVKLIKGKIKQIGLPADIHFSFGGEYEEQVEAFSLMKISALIAVILVYMVMASQFESLIQPFFILLTIPFALVGVVWLLLLTGTYFTVDSFLGVIMLIGIVVNNAIVLISYINLLRDRGMDIKEAVLVGSKRRLRPILLTSLTTIFGLLPLSFQAGEGSEYWRPFSNAIIGGLSISFVITLFIIPLIYYLYERKSISRD